MEITTPSGIQEPQVNALPEPAEETLPAALKILSQPVRITSERFDGQATLTFGYEPSQLPADADPLRDIAIFLYLPEYELWIPVGGQ